MARRNAPMARNTTSGFALAVALLAAGATHGQDTVYLVQLYNHQE